LNALERGIIHANLTFSLMLRCGARVRNLLVRTSVYLTGWNKTACSKIPDTKKAKALFDNTVREFAAYY